MPMGVKREVTLAPPCTLEDMQEFVRESIAMGVSPTKVLAYDITNSYSDPRESSPGSFTLTARP